MFRLDQRHFNNRSRSNRSSLRRLSIYRSSSNRTLVSSRRRWAPIPLTQTARNRTIPFSFSNLPIAVGTAAVILGLVLGAITDNSRGMVAAGIEVLCAVFVGFLMAAVLVGGVLCAEMPVMVVVTEFLVRVLLGFLPFAF